MLWLRDFRRFGSKTFYSLVNRGPRQYRTSVQNSSWWHHQLETFSALLAICAENSPVPGEFPAQRPVTRSFDVFSDLRLNKQLSKQSWGWWFETLSCSLWRHRNVLNSNFMQSHSSITSISVIQSFCNLAQSSAVSLPCSVQNFKMIGWKTNKLWANEFSQDLGLRWVSDGYAILHSTPEHALIMAGLWQWLIVLWGFECSDYKPTKGYHILQMIFF